MESGVHFFLHENCHHQVIYEKINLKVFYPSPYKREIWHYQRANVDLIQQAIEQFSWEKSFRNLNINEMVFLFNKTIKNIFQNFICHETVTCDDRDPLWINKKINQLIQEKNNTYRSNTLKEKKSLGISKIKVSSKTAEKFD